MAEITPRACTTLGIPDYKFAYPLDKDGNVLSSLWDITWTNLHIHEEWLQTLFATKYQRLNKFIVNVCRNSDSIKIASSKLPYDLVPDTVQVTRCYKNGVAYEVVVKHPNVQPQIGVIKIIPFGEHLEALYKFQSNISSTINDLKKTTKYMLHPWLETIVLNQLSKSLFWGHINVDISDYLHPKDVDERLSESTDFNMTKWLKRWKNRYVVIFMSKFHESVWNYFVTIQQSLTTTPARVLDIYGQVLWGMFAQIMFKTLPQYKVLGTMCQNDSKIDNMMYLKSDTISDVYIRVHRSGLNSAQESVVLKIPTFKRIIYPMDFGFTSLCVPNSKTDFVASVAALLYTNIDSLMSTNNIYTDYYQIMLSILSFYKHFIHVKNEQFQSLMTTLLLVLSQTMKLKPEQLKTAGTLATETDIHNFYIETSKCTVNPLPFLLEVMLKRYNYQGDIPNQTDVVHDVYL